MPDPPDPHFPSELFAIVARLGFLTFTHTPDGTPVGTFQDANGAVLMLVAVSNGAIGGTSWALLPSPLPRGYGYAGHLVTRASYDVMHGGAPAADGCGAIVYQGATYRVRSLFNEPGHEARAVTT